MIPARRGHEGRGVMGISRMMSRLEHAGRGDDADGFVAWPYVDTLYDYTRLLGAEPIAGFPRGTPPAGSVASVGAGPAGIVAAYELLRAGVVPVVFEATGRIGGRNWTRSAPGARARPRNWSRRGRATPGGRSPRRGDSWGQERPRS